MKKIVAIIRSSKFDEVKEALNQIDINFFTFMEVKGYGKQKGEHVVYRGAVYDAGYIARLKLEIFTTEEITARAVKVIRESAHTGEIGDGKICVINMEELTSIRTGHTNESAL
jgi:nitrogen regulatory protein PII